ncbi:MAG TPA: glycerophosphodiester phosphodiesterase family protein [Thermomicrobiales bacterium]|nr:glycerophosphodiester phosphodiesterase family protein [Thermomicrobiales bacterium]
MLIYGHRGESASEPENTLRAFERALQAGVDGIELDVQATADGVPVVIHDRDLTRTTNGSGRVNEVTFDQLRQLDAGSGEKVPTLDEVLSLVGDRAHLDIEFKQTRIERAVLEQLNKHPTVEWSASSFKWGALKTLRALGPAYDLWLLDDFVTDEVIETARTLGASTAAIGHAALNEDTVARLRAANLKIFAWTVNGVEEARRMEKLGIDILCTDAPTKMINALAGVHD